MHNCNQKNCISICPKVPSIWRDLNSVCPNHCTRGHPRPPVRHDLPSGFKTGLIHPNNNEQTIILIMHSFYIGGRWRADGLSCHDTVIRKMFRLWLTFLNRIKLNFVAWNYSNTASDEIFLCTLYDQTIINFSYNHIITIIYI